MSQKTVDKKPKKPGEQIFDEKELKKWSSNVAAHIRGTAKKVEEKEVAEDEAENQKRQQKMKAKKPFECVQIYWEPSPDQEDNIRAKKRDDTRQIDNYSGTPVWHLTVREDVAQKRGSHREQQQKTTTEPKLTFAWWQKIDTTKKMQKYQQQKKGGSVGMAVAQLKAKKRLPGVQNQSIEALRVVKSEQQTCKKLWTKH